MIPHAFGESAAFTVGIEEELFCLDAETLAPRPFPREALDGARLKEELFASVVELNTGVHATAAEAVAELGVAARSARRTRRERPASSSPRRAPGRLRVPEEQPVGESPAYRTFVEYAGPSARRQYVSGLHVHVGMESPEACMAALEAVLPWLPLVLALSANSPYVAGEDTGLRSARAEILALLPRSAAPPVFARYEDWERFVERLVALGLADEITRVWWDVRPHPRFGTLEIRIADQPTRARDDGGARGAAAGDGLPARGRRGRPTAASTRRTAGPPPFRARGGARPSRTDRARVGARAPGRAGRARRLDRRPARVPDQAREQLEVGRARARVRVPPPRRAHVGSKRGRADRDHPGDRRALRALRHAARRRPRGPGRPRGREREPDGRR